MNFTEFCRLEVIMYENSKSLKVIVLNSLINTVCVCIINHF